MNGGHLSPEVGVREVQTATASVSRDRWRPHRVSGAAEIARARIAPGRTGKLLGAIGSSLVSRSLGLLAPIILIPYAIGVLGVELYGLWATVTALTAMAVFADLGLGNGLMTKLTRSIALGRSLDARQQIATAYLIELMACVAVLGAVVTVHEFELADGLVKGSSVSPDDARRVVLACGMAFAINVPCSLIHRIQYAAQHISRSNWWQALGGVASALAFILADLVGASPVGCVSASASALPAVAAVNTIAFFGLKGRHLSPLGAKPSPNVARSLLGLGMQFLGLSVFTSVGQNIDPVLVSREVGLEAAAQYAIAFKLTSLLIMLVALVNTPLWPLCGDGLARGDTAWVRKTTALMSGVSVGVVLTGSAILLGPLAPRVKMWLDAEGAVPSRGLQIGMACWALALAATSAVFMLQNAAGIVWPQLVGWAVFLVVSIPAKLIVLGAGRVELLPVVATGIFSFVVLPSAIYGMRLALSRASSRVTGMTPIDSTIGPIR